MRVRGLKLSFFDNLFVAGKVAPHAGAWIETTHGGRRREQTRVAPHAGAWIETELSEQILNACPSHPVRVRGLKL